MLRHLDRLRSRLLALPRTLKRLLQVAVDLLLVWLALWLAFVLRLGGSEGVEPLGGHAWLFVLAPLLAIPLYIRSGLYRAVLRYVGNDALWTLLRTISLSALLLALAIYWYQDAPAFVPRSLVFNYWWLSLCLVGGLRLLMRQFFLGNWLDAGLGLVSRTARQHPLPRVAIYGAGAAGNQLVAALRLGRAMQPVAFIDDNPGIQHQLIAGLRVYAPAQITELLEDLQPAEILLAIPSASRARRREVLNALERYAVPVRSMPGFMDLASGRVKVDDLQEVDIADLLGRDAVAPDAGLLARCIRDQAVLVTGAGGSIGSELCRQIITQAPRRLVLLEHSEYALYAIHQELQRLAPGLEVVPILGSIRNHSRLLDVLRHWRIDTLYHAAAYKHVPMVEHNIAEGIHNNVLGTLNAAQAAIIAGVRHFVLISTDKAVRPTNVMGCSKRLAEMVLQALASEAQPVLYGREEPAPVNRTRFAMVRFGNVLGSSGSVIPLFREQIRRGGPVTVTHPQITRYFMTIPEAAQLVIQAGAMDGQGGDVYVLDMGEPVRIAELAERMIHLSGLSVRSDTHPLGDIAITYTGLRPGEKLYEELLIGDNATATDHPMICRAREQYLDWAALRELLAALQAALRADDFVTVRALLLAHVDGYRPEGGIVDWLYAPHPLAPGCSSTAGD